MSDSIGFIKRGNWYSK